ncbi:hypothetical protein EYF80_009784 [Liparis tanakae]|uniref:Uncharacterized protein n=1 Tax=Liparis tanakae TaxID=230148 RepID=A0A4Z2IQA3_9TELE|nr:hypothetical protein EYF80_009784 [Liparis tanakae]
MKGIDEEEQRAPPSLTKTHEGKTVGLTVLTHSGLVLVLPGLSSHLQAQQYFPTVCYPARQYTAHRVSDSPVMLTVEHLAAKEPDVPFRSRWGPKTEL